MDVPVATLPFALQRPDRQTAPVVVASPHSGRDYPPEFIAAARLDTLGLRRSEDSFVDELFASAPDYGVPLLTANFPRAFCDPNREPWELDPAMFEGELPSWVNTTSPRVGAGLGTIARVVASGEMIYRDKLSFSEAERRVRNFWQPYHATLTELIEQTRQIFGVALLVDCHSMPAHGSSSRHGGQTADFVLGDAHGTACSPRVVRLVERILTGLGYTVRRNDPYSGGYVTRHYGRPREAIHVLQIEVSRGLYMDELRIERIDRFLRIRQDLSMLLASLTAEVSEILLSAAR